MVLSLLVVAALSITADGQPAGQPGEKCCDSKVVGGIEYTLTGQMNTQAYQCLNDCVYQKTGETGMRYCFAMGDEKVECQDEEGKPTPPAGGGEGATQAPGGDTKAPGGATQGQGGATQGQGGATQGQASDEVITRVKSYIDSTTCNTVTYSDYSDSVCGDNAVSYYNEFTYNNKRVVVSNNIPDHPAENDMLTSNPNVRCPGWQFIQLPIDPAKGSSATNTALGTIGLAITGGAFFNDLSNPDGSLALPNEGASLDSCLGHSAPAAGGGGGGPPGGGPPGGGPPPGRRYKRQGTPTAGRYHYHANLNCTDAGAATGANDPDTCLLIGYYNDGVPVYGFCKDTNGMMMTSCYKTSATLTTTVTVSGTYETATSNSDYTYTPDSLCNLDEASGAVHPTTGQYSYFMTTGYPWTPIKFFGDQEQGEYCGAD